VEFISYHKSLFGLLEIVTENDALIGINFIQKLPAKHTDKSGFALEVEKQLEQYFLGKLKKFDLKLKLIGTDFQKNVWNELINIGYGETVTYKDIAIKIGNEKGCRAVGNANNKNKIPIIIPCHRVIGSNNKLVGYAGGLDKKEWLINLEKGFN
jgi:methylated-DNA-[protein]-cysteine S-methyltransferase